jgi:hypothetical protein
MKEGHLTQVGELFWFFHFLKQLLDTVAP